MDFDWRTDTDSNDDWADDADDLLSPIGQEQNTAGDFTPDQPNNGLSKQQITLLTIGAILAIAIFMVFSWGENQIDERESLLERDIRGSYELLYRAIETEDQTHLQGVLNWRDREWAKAQIEMIEDGVYLDRPIYDLYATIEGIPAPEIEILPDQRSAFVLWVQPYLTSAPKNPNHT